MSSKSPIYSEILHLFGQLEDHKVLEIIDAGAQGRVPDVSLAANPSLPHDGPGVFGLSGPTSFYLTLDESPGLDDRFTALGRVVAGAHTLTDFAAGDRIRSIRILRSGEEALAFSSGR